MGWWRAVGWWRWELLLVVLVAGVLITDTIMGIDEAIDVDAEIVFADEDAGWTYTVDPGDLIFKLPECPDGWGEVEVEIEPQWRYSGYDSVTIACGRVVEAPSEGGGDG